MTSQWNPEQYDRFRAERQQPFFELLSLIRRKPGRRIVDLGCGTGELTAILHRELQARETVGIDRSTTMLAKSPAAALPGLRFENGDIATYAAPQPFDLVFSNAALQWIDDHPQLFERITQLLAADGELAVQMPANHDHPSHVIAHETAAAEPFRSALDGYVRRVPVLAPEAYATLLQRLGFRQQHVRLQVYAHHLAARDQVIEWVKGTLLVDYQEHLPAELFELYLARYSDRLLPLLADTQPYFYPFKRLLLWAHR